MHIEDQTINTMQRSGSFHLSDGLLLLVVVCLLVSGSFTFWAVKEKSFSSTEETTQIPTTKIDARTQKIIRESQEQIIKNPSYKSYYNFLKVGRAFDGKTDVSRAMEINRYKLEHIFMQSVPLIMHSKVKKLLPMALTYAEQYQVDPIWILAVMWTESHFRYDATSPKLAFGPMQIMPDTAEYLKGQLQRDLDFVKSRDNIEMGVFYLRWLLDRFSNNYIFATVAYNMGPYWVQKRLKSGGPIGVSNDYLNKVKAYYQHLASRYQAVIAQRKLPYLETLVYMDKERVPYDRQMWNELRPWFNPMKSWGQILLLAFDVRQGHSHGQL